MQVLLKSITKHDFWLLTTSSLWVHAIFKHQKSKCPKHIHFVQLSKESRCHSKSSSISRKFHFTFFCPLISLYSRWSRAKCSFFYVVIMAYFLLLKSKVAEWQYACKSWCKCIFHYQCRVSYHWMFTEITYMGTWKKFAKPIEWFESESRHMF